MATNARVLFTRFAQALNNSDIDAMAPLVHPEFTAFSPQSGELSRGFAGFRQEFESYPGGHPMIPDDARVMVDDDRWALTPAFTVVPLSDSDRFTLVSRVPYPDGRIWHVVALIELRDDMLFRMEAFYAPELPAPLAESIATYQHGR